ncbi:MAG: YbaB/EbfC family nucleoid-associated protein [Candidatus Eremiobacterota bacterium]
MMNPKKMMNQIKKMQDDMMKIQDQLATELVEESAGGGMVKATVTGQLKIHSVKIDPSVVDPEDMGMLEDLVVVAINKALEKAQELSAQKMSQLTGGIKIPGLM